MYWTVHARSTKKKNNHQGFFLFFSFYFQFLLLCFELNHAQPKKFTTEEFNTSSTKISTSKDTEQITISDSNNNTAPRITGTSRGGMALKFGLLKQHHLWVNHAYLMILLFYFFTVNK